MSRVNRNVNETQIKVLWGKSGNRCAICKREITQEAEDGRHYPLGVMAHIEGFGPGSKRHNPNLPMMDLNSYSNLILLCPSCHTVVDNDPKKYTVSELKDIKQRHEKEAMSSTESLIPDVTFAEIAVITDYLVHVPVAEEKPLTLIHPSEKIKRSGLSPDVENLIRMGMARTHQVRSYLTSNPDIRFPERLRSIFVNKYLELRDQGFSGDSLFFALLESSSNRSNKPTEIAAALTVLAYFFEICEVFSDDTPG